MSETSIPEGVIKCFDSWLEYYGFQNKVPGISIAIIDGQETVFEKSYGFSNVEEGQKVCQETRFPIASISKVFTSTGIMKLSEEDRLNLSDKISEYLPLSDTDATIRDVLMHSSGFKRDWKNNHWNNGEFPSKKQLKKCLNEDLIIRKPLEDFKYSNLGFSYLGMIIEEVTELEYREFIQQEILEPLEMESTTAQVEGKISKGYGRTTPGEGREILEGDKAEGMNPATGFCSNTSDLAKLIKDQFESSILAEHTLKEMRRTQWQPDNGKDYGLGLAKWETKGREIIGHVGGYRGFSTAIGFEPEEKIGIVVLTNSTNFNVTSAVETFFHTKFSAEELEQKEEPEKGLMKYTGTYKDHWSDSEVRNIKGNLVLYYLPGKPLKNNSILKHIEKDRFKAEKGLSYGSRGEIVEFNSKNQDSKSYNFGGAISDRTEIFDMNRRDRF